MLFLTFYKLYRILQKGQFVYYGPPLEKYCMQISSDIHAESSKTKTFSHAKIRAILLSKPQISWQAVSPQQCALTRKVRFAATFSQEKTTVSTTWGGDPSMWKSSLSGVRISPRNIFVCPWNMLHLSKHISMMQMYIFKKKKSRFPA